MKIITVTTQAELDAIPQDFAGVIRITGGTDAEPIVISKSYPEASAELWGSSSAVLRESSSAELRESSSAVLWESSSAVLRESSSAVLRESSSAELWGSSSAELWGSSSAVLRESSSAVLRESSSAELWGFSQIVKISRRSKAEIHDMARCVEPTADIDTFCTYHSINRDDDKSVWYKAVHHYDDGTYHADHDKEFVYTVGENKSVCYLDTDPEKNCGSGIHIATMQWALDYGRGWRDLAILEVEVKTAGVIVPYESDGKCRVDRVKVLREVPLDECGLLGKMLARKRGEG